MDPSTALPTSVSFLGGFSRVGIVMPPTAPGARPFPLGTPFKRFTVTWSSIYGV